MFLDNNKSPIHPGDLRNNLVMLVTELCFIFLDSKGNNEMQGVVAELLGVLAAASAVSFYLLILQVGYARTFR